MDTLTVPAVARPRSPTPRDRLVIVAVVLVAFVTALDNTLLTVAVATIARDLHLAPVAVERVGTAYLLPFAALLLAGGRVADRWGRAETLLVGCGVFVAASVAATFAPGGEALIAARAVQGAGGALLLPATLAVVATDLDGRARRAAAGLWTAAIAVALSVGPVLGGVTTQVWGWRSVFGINVLVAVPAAVVAWTAVPRRGAGLGTGSGTVLGSGSGSGSDSGSGSGSGAGRDPGRPVPLGVPVLGAATVALVAGTDALLEWQQGGIRPWLAGAVAVLAAAGFVGLERRGHSPLLPGHIWTHPVFAGGTVAQVLWGLGVNGVFFFTPLYLQDVLGLGPAGAGLVFLPVALAVAVGVPLAGWATARFGSAAVSATGLLLTAIGLAGVALARPGHGVVGLLPGLLGVGVGSGLTTPLTDRVLAAMPTGAAGAASGVVSAARELSGALGIAVVGLVLAVHAAPGQARGEVAGAGFLTGYREGLLLGAVVVATAAPVAGLALRRRGPREVPGVPREGTVGHHRALPEGVAPHREEGVPGVVGPRSVRDRGPGVTGGADELRRRWPAAP